MISATTPTAMSRGEQPATGEPDGPPQTRQLRLRQAGLAETVKPLGQAPTRAQHADIAGLRSQRRDEGGRIELHVMGRDGNGGPLVRSESRQGRVSVVPPVGDGDGRRRPGPVRTDDRHVPALLPTCHRDGEGEGVAPYHKKPLRGNMEAIHQPRRPGLLAQRSTAPAPPVAQITDGASGAPGGEQRGNGWVAGTDRLKEEFDTATAREADVHEPTAPPIGQDAGTSVPKRLPGVEHHIAFHAAARHEAPGVIPGDQHLGANRAWTAFGGMEGDQHEGLAQGHAVGHEGAHVLGQSLHRPVGRGRDGLGFLDAQRWTHHDVSLRLPEQRGVLQGDPAGLRHSALPVGGRATAAGSPFARPWRCGSRSPQPPGSGLGQLRLFPGRARRGGP